MDHVVEFGSHVYGVNTKKSDFDYYRISEKFNGYTEIRVENIDVHEVSPKHFQEMLDDHHIAAMEVYFFSKKVQNDFKFDLNLSDLRRSISAVVSNSWVKAKKKMVKEGEDYIGRKSMWHSIRILMYGIQIAKHGRIVDFKEANQYYNDIVMTDTPYEVLKNRYHDMMLKNQTEFRILAPLVKVEGDLP